MLSLPAQGLIIISCRTEFYIKVSTHKGTVTGTSLARGGGGGLIKKKLVSCNILAKFQGSRRLEFFFDTFSESRFLLKG